MNFKDFQFSIGKLKADVHSQIAKNNPLYKQDTKALSLWLHHEKSNVSSMRVLVYERAETIKSLKAWIKEEEENDDLDDIVGDKLCRLFEKQVELEQQLTDKYQQYHLVIKSIREREAKLGENREKRRTLQSRIKSNPKSTRLNDYQKELKQLQEDAQASEMDLADFKRFALKEAFYLRFNAMNEYAEKMAMLAGYGRYLVDLIDIEPTETPQRRPYEQKEEAETILNDAIQAMEQWKPKDERPTLVEEDMKGKSVETTAEKLDVYDLSPPPPPPPAYQENGFTYDDLKIQQENGFIYDDLKIQQEALSHGSTTTSIILPESTGPIYIQQHIIHPYNQMNYSQLYRHVSQRQHDYRSYLEFQQQQWQRIDAEPSAPSILLL